MQANVRKLPHAIIHILSILIGKKLDSFQNKKGDTEYKLVLT